MKNCQQELSKEASKSQDKTQLNGVSFILNALDLKRATAQNEESQNDIIQECQDFYLQMNEVFFDVWSDESDPSIHYFPQLKTYQDYNLLVQVIKKKKVLWMCMLATMLNLANLLIPDTFCFVMFPTTFFFQFIVNTTIIFTMIMQEAIRSRYEFALVLGNSFFVNYIAIEGLKFYHKEFQQNADASFNLVAATEEFSRAYLIGIFTLIIANVQKQQLNQNLIKMLVNKINCLQQSLDIKDTYNASMIHELRNPLNAILGAIGLLKYSRTLSKEDHETLNIAGVSGEILITLINNALDGAKLEANRLELDPHKSDIVETLTKAASLFQWKAKEKKINISLKIGKKMPNLVEIDEARITQILVNIIGNAVKFTPEKGQIKVRARFMSDDNPLTSTYQQLMAKMNSMNSYLEDDEYEQRFFENKELFQDMGQASEEQAEEKISNRWAGADPRTNGSVTPHDYELDSFTDKSMDPQISHVNNLPVTVNMNLIKSDSFTSLCNVDSIEERKTRSKSNIGERELDFKNSFHEWSATFVSKPININKIIDKLSDQEYQPIQTENMTLANGNNNPLLKNHSDFQIDLSQQQINQQDKRKTNSYLRDSQIFSEKIKNDVSLSIESNFEDRKNFRTLTNSSHSNNYFNKRKNQTKSKFFQQMDSDNLNDVISDDQQSQFNQQLHISEQFNNLQQQNLSGINNRPVNQECKGMLIIEVIDNGIGISQEGIKKLFQPFQQADKSIQAKYGGTGLGLWITNKLVALMRGKVEVASELNKGTTFIIKIPVTGEFIHIEGTKVNNHSGIQDDESSKSSQYEGVFTGGTFGDKGKQHSQKQSLKSEEEINVLLFQKDEIMTKLFKKYLQKHQMLFKFATSFKDILRSFRFSNYNACFIDIDINVTAEDLDKLVTQIQTLKEEDKNYHCKIYSRDIEKTKAKILSKNEIKCLKKPLQGYQLSKLLRRIKKSDMINSMKIKAVQDNNSYINRQDDQQINIINNNNNNNVNTPSSNGTFQQQFTFRNKLPYSKSSNQKIQPAQSKNNGGLLNSARLSFNNEQRNLEDSLMVQASNNKNKIFNEVSLLTNEEDKDCYYNGSGFLNSQRDQRVNNSNIKTAGFQTPSSSQGSSANIHNFQQQQQHQQQPYQHQQQQQQQQQQMFVPKINKQIQRIKMDEMMNTSLLSGGDPLTPRSRNASSKEQKKHQQYHQQQQHYNTQRQQQPSEEFVNLLTKNARRQTISSQKKQNFLQINVSDSDDEEEKKSNKKQANTPNFNYLSIKSPSVAMNSDKQSNTNEGESSAEQSLYPSKKNSNNSRTKFSSTLPSGGVVAAAQIEATIPRQSTRQHDDIEKVLIGNGNGQPAVLVVDDNKMNQFIVQRMLEKVPQIVKSKVELLVADNGEEAFEKFKHNYPRVKLVLMDCEMPILDGYEASKKIRDFEGQIGQNINNDSMNSLIIGLSGNQGEQHVRKCKQAGMNDAITKPIVFEQLKSMVKKALEPAALSKSTYGNQRFGSQNNTLTINTQGNNGTNMSLTPRDKFSSRLFTNETNTNYR